MADSPVATASTTAGAPAPAAAQPAGAGTAEGSTGVQPSGPAKVDLSQLESLLSSPEARELVEQRFVKPAISKVEFNRQQEKERLRQEIAAEDHQRRVAVLQSQAESPDENVRNRALLEMGRLGMQATRQQTEAQRTADLQRTIVAELAKQSFGVDIATIPQEAFASNEALGRWLVRNSSVGKAEFESMMGQAKAESQTVQQSQETAQFASRLATTPAPTFGSDPARPASAPAPLSQEEFDQNRGDLKWLRVNLPRMRDAMARGVLK
jgi:hypothetical protein